MLGLAFAEKKYKFLVDVSRSLWIIDDIVLKKKLSGA